ncbi:MAG TPA: efflux RND transporter periplasmic adaptor subunit [Bacteroidota bacterium]|nr:efflux RND transporter periplasmic adaptor subunit [Bacteroidota bacterium]
MANNKKSKKKVIIFSIIGALVIILGALVIMGSKKEPVFTVQTEKTQRRIITQAVTATGKIYPEVQVTITPEVSGEIISLPLREGAKVKKGDLLLKIRPDIYIAMRDQSASGLQSAKASLQKSESDYKRAKDMYSKGLISDADLEQASTTYQLAKANYDQADAGLNQASESLAKTTIYSPMDGTVSQLSVELGDRVLGTSQFQGTTIMIVADLSRMEARVDVGENDIITVSVGDTTRVAVDALPERKLTGIVYEIGNSAKTTGAGTQEEVTNFEVKIRVLDKDVILRPGMSMTATIETETKKNVLAVPIQCVTTRSNNEKGMNGGSDQQQDQNATNDSRIKVKNEKPKEIVFIVDNNVVKSVEVKRGIADDTYVEIISGLAQNQEVVSGSYKAISRELEDGSKVKVDNVKHKLNEDASK